MRSEGFSRRAAQMNHVFEAAARRTPGVAYLELGMLLTGRDEGYSTFVRDEEGRLLRVRMEDGGALHRGGREESRAVGGRLGL